jgi:hypothetical protein
MCLKWEITQTDRSSESDAGSKAQVRVPPKNLAGRFVTCAGMFPFERAPAGKRVVSGGSKC